jgi:hypothetical protein
MSLVPPHVAQRGFSTADVAPTTCCNLTRHKSNSGVGIVVSSTRDGFAGAHVAAEKPSQGSDGLVANLPARIRLQSLNEVAHDIGDTELFRPAPLTAKTVQRGLAHRRYRIS